MKRIIEFFVRNHVFADLLSLVVVLFGIYAMTNIRRETFPNVNFDVITITTIFPGAAPEEIEKLITNPIEQDLVEIDGVKKLTSTSVESRSAIVIYLDPDQTDQVTAKEDVKDVIDKLSDLPKDAEDPKVTALETKNEPIIELALYGDLPDIELRAQAKKLERALEKVPGIAKVTFSGERDLEIHVEANQNQLSRYRVTLDEVINALRAQNVSAPAGPLEEPERERAVRVMGDFKTDADVGNTVIRANELGQSIHVRDVATVRYALERAQTLDHFNGQKAVRLTVAKKEKADAIKVVDALKERVAELAPTLDSRVRYDFVNDFSYYIRNRLSIVTSNLLIGLFCVLFLLPFLLPFRFAFLVALGEPFAFLGAILVLYWTGQSINLISMIGLIIVSGILVDDSIVVTENAVRRIEAGEDPKDAAVNGTLQIFGPLTASVATTGIVFLPMAFMSGIFGKFVVEIPIAVLTCLIVSLFETYLILPAHIAHWIKVKKPTENAAPPERRGLGIAQFFQRASARSIHYWDTRVEPAYVRILEKFLRRRYWVVAGVTSFFIFSIFVGSFYVKKRFILFPPDGVEIFFIRTEMPNGTSLEKHAHSLKFIENLVGELPQGEVLNYVTNIGIQQQDPHDPFTRRGSEFAQVSVYLTPENQRDRTAVQIIDDLRAKIGQPENMVRVTFDRLNPGPPTGKPVSLGVRGREFAEILPAVNALKDKLASLKGVTDITDSYTLGKEEVRIKVDADKAASAGVTVANVGFTTRAALEGIEATSVKTLDEEYKVRVSLPRQQTTDVSVLNQLLIPNPVGNLIPLSQISSTELGQGPLSIQHEANERQITVSAGVNNDITSSLEVNGLLKDLLPEFNKKFPNVTIAFGGEDEDTQESFASLGRTFLVAVAGVYLILVLTFGNLLQPFVVMLTVPLGLVSVLWAFMLHGLPISFMGCLGAVALTGVIVNNAIVLVDFINQHKNEKRDFLESILYAAKDRLRPIFLTTVTTVIGVLPTAYGIGGLDKFVVPIAMSLGWGLMFGAFLTAFVFPPVMAILEDFRALLARKKA